MKLTQLAEGIAKKRGKFERLLDRYFKVEEEDADEGDIYYPIDDVMITHNGVKVSRIAIDWIKGDDGDDTVHVGDETSWRHFARTELNTPKHEFILWKKTNY